MTGLPMVFAVWAGRAGVVTAPVAEAFRESCRFGRERIEEIVASEAPRREFAPALVREYLTRNIVHELEAARLRGDGSVFAIRPEAGRRRRGANGPKPRFDRASADLLY